MSSGASESVKKAAGANAPALSPTREEDFPEWYQQVIVASDLAENSEVRGCMVIKPWGYRLWELLQEQLDAMFKATGHENAYFPLFIPLSYLAKEAQHIEGFAKECAVVTHSRLETNAEGKLVPAGELSEPLIVRPTSETIIGAAYARWVQSYRDLPILVNQWCNVVRWEMRPRLFLRTAEFLWQEGHTAHETAQEAIEETNRMLGVYETFARDHAALPVIAGRKSEGERFPGAVDTLTIEAMVQDRKAVQAATSHFLGQNFAKASGIQFLSRENKQEFAWTTSWGMSTRMIGTILMAHSDDDGLVLPPRLAAQHVVIVPVTPKPDSRVRVLDACEELARKLRAQLFHGQPIRVKVDARDSTGSHKNWEWIKKGVPIRIEIGPRDLESGTVMVARRDRSHKEKEALTPDVLAGTLAQRLQEIQDGLLEKARAFRDANTKQINSREELVEFFTPKSKDAERPEIHGGFALMHWAGDRALEAQLKEELKISIRCLPTDKTLAGGPGTCPFTGRPSPQRVVFAKAY